MAAPSYVPQQLLQAVDPDAALFIVDFVAGVLTRAYVQERREERLRELQAKMEAEAAAEGGAKKRKKKKKKADTAEQLEAEREEEAALDAQAARECSVAHAFREACQGHVDGGDISSFVREILRHAASVLALPSQSDVEAVFEGLVCIVFSIQDDDAAVESLIRDMVAELSRDTSPPTAPSRMRVLVALLNVLPSSGECYRVLTAALDYASASGLLADLGRCADRVDDLAARWALDDAQRGELYRRFAAAFEAAGDEARARRFLVALLRLPGLSEDAGAALRLVVASVKSPPADFSARSRVLKLAAVQRLRDAGGDAGAMVELLRVLCEGTLAEYEAFAAAHAGAMEAHGVDAAALLGRARLLALCDLAAERNTIPYDDVAAQLRVDAAEVEAWVVRAVAADLLEARMDQFRREVVVSRCTRRHFGAEQWKVLQQQLRTWRENIGAVIQGMQQLADPVA